MKFNKGNAKEFGRKGGSATRGMKKRYYYISREYGFLYWSYDRNLAKSDKLIMRITRSEVFAKIRFYRRSFDGLLREIAVIVPYGFCGIVECGRELECVAPYTYDYKKNIVKVYSISKEEYKRGEYRQNRETVDIETEAGWNYADIIRNNGSYAVVNCVVDCGDLYVWEIIRDGYVEDDQVFEGDVIYVVELKK